MSDATPKLEPKQLFEKRASRDKARLRAYNQMLEQIHHRIFTTSQLPGNPNYLMYTVPPFILGLPSIDLEDCIVYIVFNTPGAVPAGAPGAPEAKAAAEYTPPASFLTTMERPQNPPRPGATGAGNILADLWNFT